MKLSAVDRINDPEVVALGGADAAGFFRLWNGVIGIGVLQAVDDAGFGGAVDGGHEIVDGLVNFEGVEARGGAGDFRGGAWRILTAMAI